MKESFRKTPALKFIACNTINSHCFWTIFVLDPDANSGANSFRFSKPSLMYRYGPNGPLIIYCNWVGLPNTISAITRIVLRSFHGISLVSRNLYIEV